MSATSISKRQKHLCNCTQQIRFAAAIDAYYKTDSAFTRQGRPASEAHLYIGDWWVVLQVQVAQAH
jgi:hypothetical protein